MKLPRAPAAQGRSASAEPAPITSPEAVPERFTRPQASLSADPQPVVHEAAAACSPQSALPGVLANSVGFLLGKAGHLGAQLLESALQPFDLKARHYGVLVCLSSFGPAAQHHLGELLRIDRTTMVAIADDLERRGYARRTSHPRDRRAHLVELTADGRRVLAEVDARAQAADIHLAARLSPTESAQLRDLLKKLLA